MLYAAGARLRHLGLASLTGFSGLVLLWFTVMKDYQRRRILAWLDPEKYRLNEAWQQWHAEIAIGSGGFFGRSFGAEGMSGGSPLPERHTDFIFAVAAEQGGFLVSALLLTLLCLVGVAALGVALRTREPAGRLIAVGVATLLCGQALINVGVATGLLPTTGVTLPFVSYGGSSLLSACVCLGLLTNVASRREVVLAREDFA
jgi:cell division protein FtsW (lipid II flippase)